LVKVISLAFDMLTIDTDGNGGSDDGHDLFGNTLERSRDEIENSFNDRRYIDIQTADLIVRETPYTPFRSENARHHCHTCNRPPDPAHHSELLRKPTSIRPVLQRAAKTVVRVEDVRLDDKCATNGGTRSPAKMSFPCLNSARNWSIASVGTQKEHIGEPSM
jgi:hypothetical protein